MFWKFTPEVKGESKTKGFEGWIEVLSFSWGGSNPSTIAQGGGAGAGRVDFSTLNLMLNMDASTVFAFKNMCAGKHFEKGKLICREAAGDKPVEFFIAEYFLVFVDSVQMSGAQGGGKPTVSLSLSAGAVELTYNEQDDKGGATKHGPVQWSIKKNDSSTSVS
jgi:type VI secretion system secreted protein Hcp